MPPISETEPLLWLRICRCPIQAPDVRRDPPVITSPSCASGRGTNLAAAGVSLERAAVAAGCPVGSCNVVADQRPSDIENYTRIRNTPIVLGGVLALLAVAMLTNVLVTGVRMRRRDLALLKTLGLLRRQVSAVVAWQATALIAFALVLGIPLGIVAGRAFVVLLRRLCRRARSRPGAAARCSFYRPHRARLGQRHSGRTRMGSEPRASRLCSAKRVSCANSHLLEEAPAEDNPVFRVIAHVSKPILCPQPNGRPRRICDLTWRGDNARSHCARSNGSPRILDPSSPPAALSGRQRRMGDQLPVGQLKAPRHCLRVTWDLGRRLHRCCWVGGSVSDCCRRRGSERVLQRRPRWEVFLQIVSPFRCTRIAVE